MSLCDYFGQIWWPESFLIGSYNLFSKSCDLNVIMLVVSFKLLRAWFVSFTSPTVPNLVTIKLDERELQYFTKVMWSYNYGVIRSFQVSINLIGVSYQSYCPNLVTTNLDQRKLMFFIKVTWYFIDDIISSPQVILNWIGSLSDHIVKTW